MFISVFTSELGFFTFFFYLIYFTQYRIAMAKLR
jgi:hypothetical protein